MTPCAFDSTMLSLLLNPKSKAPLDPATDKPVEFARERVQDLVRRLNKSRQKIIIPAPVTAEILSVVGPANADYLRIINRARIFEVRPFDEVAAIELAFLNRDVFGKQDKTNKVENRQKVKVDRQILAVCKVADCDTIYTDDANLRNRAEMCGMKALGIGDIPIPDSARQLPLDLEPHDDIPKAGNDGDEEDAS
jgi:predicted nucleic acid-binding protein